MADAAKRLTGSPELKILAASLLLKGCLPVFVQNLRAALLQCARVA